MARIRVCLTFQEDVYKDFVKNLVSLGYPRSTAAIILQQKMEQINAEIEHFGDSQQLELFHWKKEKSADEGKKL